MVFRRYTNLVAMILLVGGFVTSPNSIALEFNYARPELTVHYCLEELLADRFKVMPRFPIGCELVDCCPGCPGPAPEFLDLRARFSGEGITEMALQFSDASGFENTPEGLIEGSIRIRETRDIRIDDVRASQSDQNRFVTPVIEFDPNELETVLEDQASVSGVVRLRNRYGPITVYDQLIGWSVSKCELPQPAQDSITLTSNDGGDNSAVVLSGARSGLVGETCFYDEVHNVSSTRQIANVLASDIGNGCSQEAIVFSENDMMEVEDTSGVFTDAPGDDLNVALGDMVVPKLRFWLTDSPLAALGGGIDPTGDLDRAIDVFNSSRCGITFDNPAMMSNLSGTLGDTVDSGLALIELNYWLNILIDFTCDPIAMNSIKFSPFYDPTAINIYYTWGPQTGLYCSDSEIMVIGLGSTPETLAHELGHAFSLYWHVQDHPIVSVLGATNIMSGLEQAGPNPTRTQFTEGQCQRMNVEPTSRINDPVLNLRGGEPVHTCPPFSQPVAGSSRCLPLHFDP